VRVSTTVQTLQERREAAETAYHEMMAGDGRGIVEYTEPGTGLRIRKDPDSLRKYIDYLAERITTVSGSAGSRRLAAFGRPR
jgi:hypothetical protein